MYRRNAQRWNKFKRKFKKLRGGKTHDIPIQPSPMQSSQANHTEPSSQVNQAQPSPTQPTSGVKIEGNQINKGFGFTDFDLIKVIGRGSYAKVILFLYWFDSNAVGIRHFKWCNLYHSKVAGLRDFSNLSSSELNSDWQITLRNFSKRFVITIFVEIKFWLWT